MKKIFNFFGSKFVGGFLIALPILLTYLLLGQMFEGMLVLTTPIVDILPVELFSDKWLHRLTAAVLLIAICLFIGLVMATAIGKAIGHWIENRFLNAFPPYNIIRNLSQSLSNTNTSAHLKPALIIESENKKTIGFIVEEHVNGDFTVFVPLAPTATVGTLLIVGPSIVRKLDCPMKDAIGCVMNWGSGAEGMINRTTAHNSYTHDAPAQLRNNTN